MASKLSISLSVFIVVTILLSFCVQPARSQGAPPTQITPSNDTGQKPFNVYSTDGGNVNLMNGNLNLDIPIVTLPGRNGHNFVLSLQYDSKIWTPSATFPGGSDLVYTWKYEQRSSGSVGDFGWRLSWPTINEGSVIYYTNTNDIYGYNDFILTAADGSKHNFGANAAYLDAEDGSNMAIVNYNPASSWPAVKVLEKDGSSIDFQSSAQALASTLTDTNGNQITLGNNGLTDSLNRQITLTAGAGFINPTAISYKDSNGNTQTITLTYTTLTVFDSSVPTPAFTFPKPVCANGGICHRHVWVIYPQRNSTYSMLTKITLPDGKFYSFTYNGYGELTKITWPTGGYTTYDYAAFMHEETFWQSAVSADIDADFREVIDRHDCRNPAGTCGGGSGYSEDITTFTSDLPLTTGFGLTNEVNNGVMDVVDPVGYKNHHEFSQGTVDDYARYNWPRELVHKVYSETGALLRTTQTQYIRMDSFCRCYIAPSSVTTTLNDSSGTAIVTKTEYTYDTFNSKVMYPPYTPSNGMGPWEQTVTTLTRPIDNPTQILEHSYGSGSPGSVVRKTTNTWAQGSYYYTSHILNRKTDSQVFDPNSKVSETQYEYDNYTAGLGTSGAVQHAASFNASNSFLIRGNLTAIKRWRNSDGAFLTTRFQYDDAGNAIQATDPLNHSTQMSYGDSWGNSACPPSGGNAAAYLTTVTDPMLHQTHATYNSCTGTMASFTDSNGQVTSHTFDLMGRLTHVSFPDGGTSDFTYNTTSPPFSVTTKKKLDSSRDVYSTLTIDGLGRTVLTQLCEDGTSSCTQPISTDTTYDGLGRVSTVSNPHRPTFSLTDGITTTIYDALNRVTKVIPQDSNGSTNYVSTQFAGNLTTVTDEVGNQRRSYTDAQGRLIQVDEPGPTLSTPYTTLYFYDPLDNLTCVEQHGNQTATGCSAAPGNDATSAWRVRRFTYNSLSQLLIATNPESSAISYSYNNDGSLLTKTDARGDVTTMQYDSDHHVTQKSYSDSTTPTVSFGYGSVAATGCTPPTLTVNYGVDRRTSMCDAAGSEAWSYDAMGRVAVDERTTNGVTKSVTYSTSSGPYNYDGSVAQLVYPSGRTITYTPNNVGQTLSAVDSANNINYATLASYTPHGALNSLMNGSNILSTLYYNSRLQPCRIAVNSSGTAPNACADSSHSGNMLDFTYGFNLGISNNGNVASVANNRDNTRSQVFFYDALNRLSTAETTSTHSTSPTHCWGESYVYDNQTGGGPWGNLTNIIGASSDYNGCTQENPSFSVNNKNHILNPQGNDTYYDLAGNMTTLPSGLTLNYNGENQIASVNGIRYAYDGDGKRVEKLSGSTVYKIYWYGLNDAPLAETDGTGSLTDEYIFFNRKRIARRLGP